MRQVQASRVKSIFLASVMLGGFMLAWRAVGLRMAEAGPGRPSVHVTLLAPTARPALSKAQPVRAAARSRGPSQIDAPTVEAKLAAAPLLTAKTSATPEPAPTAQATVDETDVAAPTPSPDLPSNAYLSGIRHQQQTWNNCGPATLSMMLSYYKGTDTQQVIAQAIKPYRDDKNVSPDALVSYAQSSGFRARILVGGDIDLLKTLVANQFPVIVESWFIPEPGDEMGHYQLLVGYDEQTLTFYDSYHGPDVQHSVHEFDALWKVFNRLAVLVWRPEQDEQVQALLGPRWDESAMLQLALDVARADTEADQTDKFAWFNLGSTLLNMGDSAGAVAAYDNAIALKLPWRMLWYQFGPYQANFDQGNYDKVIKLTTATLRVKAGLEESYYWRGRAYAAQKNVKLARADFNQALAYRANYTAARTALDEIQ